jgi:serine phosphatase RsbU (regulator of sigma subunit)
MTGSRSNSEFESVSSGNEPRVGRIRALGAILLGILLAASFAEDEDLPGRRWLRHGLFDAYQRVTPGKRNSAPAVIVAIDEASLERYGQWPWPRRLIARLIAEIGNARPAAIGLDLLFAEPDRLSAEDDALLANALMARPTVLAVAGTGEARGRTDLQSAAAFRVSGADPLAFISRYPRALASIAQIDGAAASRALISADVEDAVRSVPLVGAIGETLLPGFGLELLRLASGVAAISMTVDNGGVGSVSIGSDVSTPVDRKAHAWIRFSRHVPARFVPAADVLDRRVAPDTFESKIVLLGVTGIGVLDQPLTPHGERVPGVEVHAQLIENIFDGQLLSLPRWARALERALLVLGGMVLLLIVPRSPPLPAFGVFAGLVALTAALGVYAFDTHHLLIDVAGPGLGFTLLFGGLLAATLGETERQRRALREVLEHERLAAARLAGELSAANRIQLGMLPAPAEWRDTRLEIAALMQPAREVGGDLYDFFRLDERRAGFVIGDVAGKGLPASMIMAIGKALMRSQMLRGGSDLGAVLARADAEIALDNRESLFITALAGVLALDDGRLEICSAGHELPWLLRAGEAPRTFTVAGGPPLGTLEDYPYRSETLALAPGDALVLVTDGVTEAMDREGALYGRQRLEALLSGIAPGESATRIADAIRDDVARHANGAEPADDLTVLVLRWRGANDSEQGNQGSPVTPS